MHKENLVCREFMLSAVNRIQHQQSSINISQFILISQISGHELACHPNQGATPQGCTINMCGILIRNLYFKEPVNALFKFAPEG